MSVQMMKRSTLMTVMLAVISLADEQREDGIDSSQDRKRDCTLFTAGEMVVLNCSSVDVKSVLFETVKQNVHVLDITYTGLVSLFDFDKKYRFQKLVVLNGSHNSIKEINSNAFNGLQALEKIDLSFNSIEQLPNDLFISLTDLKFLDISNNRLLSLPNALPMTEWFDISNNQLSSISESHSTVLFPQTVFLLGQNPFKCTCDLRWVKELISTRTYLLNIMKHLDKERFIPMCSFPELLAGKSWEDLEDDEFKCTRFDEHEFESSNETMSRKILQEVKVTVSEIGYNWIIMHWTGNVDDSGKTIEIKYHKFGNSKDVKQIVLPLSVSSCRLKYLEINSPYVICFSILSGSDTYFIGCEEIVTAKLPEKEHLLMYYFKLLAHFVEANLKYLLGLLILFISTMYIIHRGESSTHQQ